MLNILLAILFSSLLFIIFNYFKKYNINTFQAIVCNYIFAFLTGYCFLEESISIHSFLHVKWLKYSILLGVLFICVFLIMGKTAQKKGVSTASISSKMSLVIPILFGILFFNENFKIGTLIGMTLALAAVYFTSKKNELTVKGNFTLPILLFFGGGIVDTSMNYIQHKFLSENEIGLFATITFLTAFIVGCIILLFKKIKQNEKIAFKNSIAGLILGIPNYFSMYYFIKSLQNNTIESGITFTLINIGIILLTTLLGVILFKDTLQKQNYLGIVLAIIALILVIN